MEYQFIQKGPDTIKVRLKRGKAFSWHEPKVMDYLKNKIDENVNWEIEWGAAERTRNDKILIVRNDWLRNQALDRPAEI